MKLIINKQNPDPMYSDCKDYFILITKHFQFRWFTDCGEWFLYIHLGKRWWRFRGAGYMKGANKFWYYYWDRKLTKLLKKNINIPFYYIQYSVQFIKINNKRQYYKSKINL